MTHQNLLNGSGVVNGPTILDGLTVTSRGDYSLRS